MKHRPCRKDPGILCLAAAAFGIGLLLALMGSVKVILFVCAVLLIGMACTVCRR